MSCAKSLHPCLPLLAALVALVALPAQAQAQDRGLASPLGWPRSPALEVSQTRTSLNPSFNWGPVRLMPSLQVTSGGFWGGGVSVDAGGSWFGGLRLGLNAVRRHAGTQEASEAMLLAGGYRLGGQQSLSLQLMRDRRDSLGLAVSYDWPSYYLRLGLDKTRFVPQDTLRLSAGVRF